ncbi:MAG: hypothetical protein ACXU7O_12645, partial [Croceibacterium sp.]
MAHLGRVDVGDADLLAAVPEGVAVNDAGDPPGARTQAEGCGLAVTRGGGQSRLHGERDHGRQRQDRAGKVSSGHGAMVSLGRSAGDSGLPLKGHCPMNMNPTAAMMQP